MTIIILFFLTSRVLNSGQSIVFIFKYCEQQYLFLITKMNLYIGTMAIMHTIFNDVDWMLIGNIIKVHVCSQNKIMIIAIFIFLNPVNQILLYYSN